MPTLDSSDHLDRGSHLQPPVVRGYTITRVLGRGGMGVAWLAYCESPSHPVVIKTIAPTLRDDESMEARFRREARRLRALEHPNIVRFIEFVEQAHQSFLVMEYAHGELLSSILERHGPLPLAVFAPIAVQTLRGVAHAHAQGVVLRDIKPANVMLCPRAHRSEIVKLLDFGLAKAVRSDWVITRNEVLGTMGYLAPEVLRGSPPDLRSDVYSLGALFYFMVTGQLPKPEVRAHERSRRAAELPPLAQLQLHSDLPRDVTLLLHRCLAKDPQRRPVHAGHVLRSLTHLIDPAQLQRDASSGLPARHEGSRWPRMPVPPSPDAAAETIVTQSGLRGEAAPTLVSVASEPCDPAARTVTTHPTALDDSADDPTRPLPLYRRRR